MPVSENQSALTEAVFYILLSLYTPLHGYAIMQNIERLSGGRLKLGAGTLYGAIGTLHERGYIRSAAGGDSRQKVYEITAEGKRAVERELDRLEELLENGKNIAGEAKT